MSGIIHHISIQGKRKGFVTWRAEQSLYHVYVVRSKCRPLKIRKERR